MAKAKTPGKRPQMGAKPQTVPSVQTVAVDAPSTRKKTSPAQFFNEVRAEARKIVWPSRKETWITSVMVFIMVLLAALFFWVVDTGLGFAFRQIISFGS
ncbi:MAG: preprotein translocase subunit SecE [Alphaproteobacteria bacterium]|nr:MAG: preprotein translocase subunit SecE [Alphaproteobacteria bacterium]